MWFFSDSTCPLDIFLIERLSFLSVSVSSTRHRRPFRNSSSLTAIVGCQMWQLLCIGCKCYFLLLVLFLQRFVFLFDFNCRNSLPLTFHFLVIFRNPKIKEFKALTEISTDKYQWRCFATIVTSLGDKNDVTFFQEIWNDVSASFLYSLKLCVNC